MVGKFFATDVEGIEGVGAVGAVFEQVFLGLGELLPPIQSASFGSNEKLVLKPAVSYRQSRLRSKS